MKNPFKRKESNLKKAAKTAASLLICIATYTLAWVVGGLIGRKAGEIAEDSLKDREVEAKTA